MRAYHTSKRDTYAMRVRAGELFGAAVRARRDFLGLTCKEVAARMGTSVSWINKVELNACSPTLVSIIQFAQALETTPSELLKGIP